MNHEIPEEMIKELERLNDKWKNEGFDKIKIGIGLNTGEVIVGNMGSKDKFDYTVIGDNVNLASRLEGLNKIYGVPIIISESTYEQVKETFFAREIDLVRVKGKVKPTKIYDLRGKIEDVGKKDKTFVKTFGEAIAVYRDKKFGVAEKLFKKALALEPSDKVCELYIERCHELKKRPPKGKWDGVFTHKTK